MLEIRDQGGVQVYIWKLGEPFPDLRNYGEVSLHADGAEVQLVMMLLRLCPAQVAEDDLQCGGR